MGDEVSSPTLTFLGAAGSVTGSKFLVETADARVLIDAGLYQGLRELRRRNWEDPPLSANSLDAVVLTHAHLDHVGYLPRLVREGFSGPVICTRETAELAAIVLRDSARIQEEDASYANRAGFSKHHPALPLYDAQDVEEALPLMRPVPFHETVPLTDDIDVVLRSAGHILGSATLEVVTPGSRTVFSGDLGRPSHPLVAPREPLPETGVLVVESTYGDRIHSETGSEVLADACRRTLARGGTVLIPAFAVDRTELVLLALGRLMAEGAIPAVPVYVDSPMALATLEIYRRSLSGLDEASRPAGWDTATFGVPELRTARSVAESEALNKPRKPCIIISASGMATGGRVTHHLSHQLPHERNCVVLTGYQAVGTRGRQLLDGAREVKIHGRYVPVRAEIVNDPEFSVHADATEIVSWVASAPSPPHTIYLVHGEPTASAALAERIAADLGLTAVVARYGERVRLD